MLSPVVSQLVLLLLSIVVVPVLAQRAPVVLDLVPHQNEHARLARRAGPISANTVDNKTYYYVQGAVGTPQQNVRLLVATNSADLVLLSANNPACSAGRCVAGGGTYNANASSTYKYSGQNFTIRYVDNSGTNGDVITDAFSLGGQTFPNITMLVGYNGTLTDSVLGIGYPEVEVTTQKYPNLPVQIYNQKLVNIIGYSLFFNHTGAASGGRLIFGGVDTGKFYNTFETLPITPANLNTYRQTTVQLSSISMFDGNSNRTVRDTSLSVVLESGNTVLTVPTAVFQNMGRIFNATYEDGFYIYRRGSVNANTTVNLVFGSTTISIPLSDMVFTSNSTHIALALSDAGTGAVYIGMPYFKNAYTVFDYSHNQVSLARLKHDAVTDNATLISANGVAGLRGAVETSTSTAPAVPSASGSTSDDGSSGGLSTGAKAGIGVGAALGALAVIGGIAFLVLRKRKSKKQTPTPAPVMSNNAPPPQQYHQPQQPYGMGSATEKPAVYQKQEYKPLSHERESYGVMSELSAGDNTRQSGYGYGAGGYSANGDHSVSGHGNSVSGDQTLSAYPSSAHPSELYSPPTSPAPGHASEVKRKPLPPQELP